MNIEHEYTQEPICPHCGKQDVNAWELEFDGLDGDCEDSCGYCGGDYTVHRHVSIHYTTTATTSPEGEGHE